MYTFEIIFKAFLSFHQIISPIGSSFFYITHIFYNKSKSFSLWEKGGKTQYNVKEKKSLVLSKNDVLPSHRSVFIFF